VIANAAMRPLILLLGLLPTLFACEPAREKSPELRVAGGGLGDPSFEKAKQLLDEGEPAKAISVFRALLRADGPSLALLNGLAIAHAELGRPDLAADFFGEALAIAPDDPATWNNIGFAALRRDETALARFYLEKAAALGDGAARIDGNLSMLERRESRPSSPETLNDRRWGAASSPLFTMERQTAQTIRLSGLRSAAVRSPSSLDRSATETASDSLIDFDQLFDPFPRTPSRAELIDFGELFDPYPKPSAKAGAKAGRLIEFDVLFDPWSTDGSPPASSS
jgi:tetratricopeptide (TPR) repeat protein